MGYSTFAEDMMGAEEKVTWGEVCQKVGFADNLYRTCRTKMGSEFTPATPFGGPPMLESGDGDDGGADDDADFNKKLKKSALPVPPPPPEDWEYEPQGLMDHLMYGEMPRKILTYAGGALVVWLLVSRFLNAEKTTPKTATTPK